MASLLNRARMSTATTGTGTVTLGPAASGYASFAEAGAVNATSYSYCIEDGDDFEIGTGTYTASGTTFSRDVVTLSKIGGTAGTTKLNLSGTAEIFITMRAEDPYRVGGTDVSLADGGTGASLSDPNADRIMFWDDSAGAVTWLATGTGLSISGTTLNASTGPFSSEYVSSPQTITSAGALVLPHGLGARPKFLQASIVCTVADQGYSVGDVLVLDGFFSTTNAALNRGFSAVVDATNINIRFGSTATAFGHLHKTTGAFVAFTNASWNFVVMAWA